MPKYRNIEEDRKNFIGKVFSRLTITDLFVRGYYLIAVCQCSCGNSKNIMLKSIISLKVISCGCYAKERRKEIHVTHGQTHTRTYSIWQSMKDRCHNPNNTGFCYYGAKGISVCQRWLERFENFLEDMGQCPGVDMSIDRIDNNGNYCLENCRWTDTKTQARNKTSNRKVLFNGQSITIAELVERTGISQTRLWERIVEQGLSPENAVNMPVVYEDNYTSVYIIEGEEVVSVIYAREQLGCSRMTLNRLIEGHKLKKVKIERVRFTGIKVKDLEYIKSFYQRWSKSNYETVGKSTS